MEYRGGLYKHSLSSRLCAFERGKWSFWEGDTAERWKGWQGDELTPSEVTPTKSQTLAVPMEYLT